MLHQSGTCNAVALVKGMLTGAPRIHTCLHPTASPLRRQLGAALTYPHGQLKRAAATASADTVVLVESPAKAKKIQNYLGPAYQVIASYGHVRDLPPKAGSVAPDQDFNMQWEVLPSAHTRLAEIAESLKSAKALVLATDPDREGEAISWHLQQELQRQGRLKGIDLSRITFTEVTKAAVLAAMQAPRSISGPLVNAYLARRALDYLVGFSLSPLLWRKLPGARSAGRVQSVALRLVSEREAEIEAFKADEYWTIEAALQTEDGSTFMAALTEIDGDKISKKPMTTQEQATQIVERLQSSELMVASTSDREVSRQPSPPFITSTLQQDAASKLGFSPSQTMSLAQQLYEGTDNPEGEGFITYIRSDGVQIGEEALASIRQVVKQLFGKAHVASSPRMYKSKAKNAQEAHEAIRPTQPELVPSQLPQAMSNPAKLLYELIWRRTLASQMANARIKQVGVDVATAKEDVVLRATSSELAFPGYQAAYSTSHFRNAAATDSSDEEDEDKLTAVAYLSSLKAGQHLELQQALPSQHFTKPPPRFTEASLVKALEELGIGRPSTYAAIIKLLQERGYVIKENKALHVESLGRVLSAFLATYFQKYVDYGFTSSIEGLLDSVSAGDLQWKNILRDFWSPFSQQLDSVSQIAVREVINELDLLLGPHLFPKQEGQSDAEARQCPLCRGRLSLKLARSGGFIGCTQWPDCGYQRPLSADPEGLSTDAEELSGEGRLLGHHPEDGRRIMVKRGPYGAYLELEAEADGLKPRRASLTAKTLAHPDFSLEAALDLLQWPKSLGVHPERNEDVTIAVGAYGPYVKCGKTNAALPKGASPHEVSMEEAITLLAAKQAKSGSRETARRTGTKGATDTTSSRRRGRSTITQGRLDKKGASRGSATSTSKAPKKKRPPSGYNLFCKQRRQDLKDEGSSLQPTQIMQLLGKEWGELPQPQKDELSQQAKALNSEDGAEAPASTVSKAARPLSAYQLFCKQRREELKKSGANLMPTELMSLLGQEWRAMSEEAKQEQSVQA